MPQPIQKVACALQMGLEIWWISNPTQLIAKYFAIIPAILEFFTLLPKRD